MPGKGGPNAIDVHVGSRVRLQRKLIGMSQQRLARALQITFQQVQKYEKGATRISSSRLHTMARALSVPISYFFEQAPLEGRQRSSQQPDTSKHMLEFLGSREGLALNKAFAQISDPKVRQKLVQLVHQLAGALEDAADPLRWHR